MFEGRKEKNYIEWLALKTWPTGKMQFSLKRLKSNMTVFNFGVAETAPMGLSQWRVTLSADRQEN